MFERRHEALRCTTKIAAAVGMLFVAAPDAQAQSAEYTRGAAIWDVGYLSYPSCDGCHGVNTITLDQIRGRIGLRPGGLTVANAKALFNSAITNQPAMNGIFVGFPEPQKDDVANYLANFRGFGTIAPGPTLNFSTSSSTPQRVTLTNSGSAMLTININNGVTLEGTNPADFQATQVGNGCQAIMLPPNSSCSVDVRFMTSASGTRVAELVFNHDGNPSINRVGLSGTAAGAPPPPPPPPPAGDGGGGATEPTTLWSLLALAALFARRKLLPQSH